MRRSVVLATGLTLALVGAILVERLWYYRSVQSDARIRGIPAATLRYPTQWPLDELVTDSLELVNPSAVERRYTARASIAYSLVPLAGSRGDSVVIQAITFRVGLRHNVVHLVFDRSGLRSIEGTDIPEVRGNATARHVALRWLGDTLAH